MKDFIENILRYARFLISIVLGVVFFAIKPLAALMQRPVTAIALVTALVGSFISLTLVLRAMLGLDAL